MKLFDRQILEGTRPRMTIGRRDYRDRTTGHVRIARPYWAQFFWNGRQHQRPLGTANKDSAIRTAYRLAEQLQKGADIHTKRQMTMDQIIDRYTIFCEARGLTPKTLVKYEGQLKRFGPWCTKNGIRYARSFSQDDLLTYRTCLEKVHCLSPKSIYSETILVKQLFKWASRNGLVEQNPIASLQFANVKSPKQPCFTLEQVELLLSKAKPWMMPILAMLAFTGIRIGELAQLHWEDLDLERNIVHICRGGSNRRPKDKDDRFIPIHATRLRPILLRLPRTSELVFRMLNGRPVEERRMLKDLKRLCREVGLDRPIQYKLHTFRHFFASYCAQSNMSYKYALEWLGHSSSMILDLYFTMNDKISQMAMNNMTFSTEEPLAAKTNSSSAHPQTRKPSKQRKNLEIL